MIATLHDPAVIRKIPAHLSHLAEAAGSPARQEAASLVARAQSAVS